MQTYDAKDIRNVLLIGHGGSGKTTLLEAMLYTSGAITRMGTVEDGSTVSDHDPDEQRNGRSLVFGALFDPGRPAGVLFHRHGSNSADLVSILFESENYREAVVDRAFARYLGRAATPAELAHFSARVDAADPDARPIIEAVVSSREYFAQ